EVFAADERGPRGAIGIAVEVAERGRRRGARVFVVERVGLAAGLLLERGGERGSGVPVVVERAVERAARDVEIAVDVDVAERGRRAGPYVEGTEEVVEPRLLHERGSFRSALVLVVVEGAVERAAEDVEVAVAVDVAERGRGQRAHVLAVERVLARRERPG